MIVLRFHFSVAQSQSVLAQCLRATSILEGFWQSCGLFLHRPVDEMIPLSAVGLIYCPTWFPILYSCLKCFRCSDTRISSIVSDVKRVLNVLTKRRRSPVWSWPCATDRTSKSLGHCLLSLYSMFRRHYILGRFWRSCCLLSPRQTFGEVMPPCTRLSFCHSLPVGLNMNVAYSRQTKDTMNGLRLTNKLAVYRRWGHLRTVQKERNVWRTNKFTKLTINETQQQQ